MNQTHRPRESVKMKPSSKEYWTSTKIIICFLLFLITLTYISYSFNLSSHQTLTTTTHLQSKFHIPPPPPPPPAASQPPQTLENPKTPNETAKTNISHIVFGIATSAKLWHHRKNYIKLWWRPDQMRGNVWLDEPVKNDRDGSDGDDDDEHLLPTIKISSDTSNFVYNHPKGHRSAIRLSRIVSENFRLGMEDVRWFVMGDDDTFFVAENLVRVLGKYDHNQFYYIGSSSESHLQNIYFSYNMAYGGGGIAISYPLAKELEKMQDRCIQRYTGLYGSDDRLQACMAELGVPLTREKGFHQFDVYGSLFGLLTTHPVTPLVSLHHLDLVEPIFPNMNRVRALEKLKAPMNIDSASLMQQSICYDKTRSWTVSVSWGYTVQILRGIFLPREMELPTRTFLNWYKRADFTAHGFNTRSPALNPCEEPFVYYFSNAVYNVPTNQTMTEYVGEEVGAPKCGWKMENPTRIDRVHVFKVPDPHLWNKSPRRNCCRILPIVKKKGKNKKSTMVIHVGGCDEDEVLL